MTGAAPGKRRRTACMLTARLGFVMSSVGFLSVGRYLPGGPCLGPVDTGARTVSCKMHSREMPSLQIAT
jgi:hypothetical protein